MTSVCVGAVASQVKAGLPTSIYISPVFMASILPVQLEWLRPFLPYIPDIFLDLTDFCAGEPPAQPSLTDATIAAVFAGGDFSAALVAGQVIQAAILNWYWYQVCECSSGTQPTAPTPQSDPGGLPAVNPPSLVSGPLSSACATYTGSGTPPHGGPQLALIGTGTQGAAGGSIALPSNTTQVRVTCTRTNSDTFITESHGEFFNAIGSFTGTTPNIDQSTNTTVTQLVAVTNQTTFKYYTSQLTGATQTTATVAVMLEFFCNGQNPGQALQPCCPPDEILNGMIRQVLQYVTLIQRQVAPFSYVYGANHTALSGNGDIGVSGLLGCAVDITTLPDNYGRSAGDPDVLFGLGSITMSTADGITSRRQLDADGILFLPGLGGVFTSINYSLSAGVVVSIRELVREP